uniref:Uncharacterized protein n=1 Tax=Arundo donax TaxID=35708 RepID=A0A0A8YB91_ARUDO
MWCRRQRHVQETDRERKRRARFC